jgi:transposase-like protein
MKNTKQIRKSISMPTAEKVQAELTTVRSMDDFFGKEGVFARLFARTMEEMLEAELSEHLGYEPYEARGRNSGNSRNGYDEKKVKTSGGQTTIQVPRDRNGTYDPQIVKKYGNSTNELEEKIIGMYGKGMSTRDIQDTLTDLYGVDVNANTVSKITDKGWPLVEAWQNRPLAETYAVVFLDAIHINLRQQGKVKNTAVYVVMGIDLHGHRDILGHWVGEGGEGSNFWLSVITDLQTRGVKDIFIACVDGLQGFSEAIHAVFPQTDVQRCIVHQIRNSLRYVSSKDQKVFMADLKLVYKAPTREEAETQLLRLGDKWGSRYTMAIRSWENNWAE